MSASQIVAIWRIEKIETLQKALIAQVEYTHGLIQRELETLKAQAQEDVRRGDAAIELVKKIAEGAA